MASGLERASGVPRAKLDQARAVERLPGAVKLYLASRSPRRRELLAGLGYRFEVVEAAIDESRADGEAPARYVERMACEKALAGLVILDGAVGATGGSTPVVLGADTIVVVDGDVLGKPRDDAQVLDHLTRLSGRDHLVLTAVAVAFGTATRPDIELRLSRNRVWFRRLSAGEREAYRATGEPADKAGSYAVQGRAAAFVTRLEGSWSAVVGLPLHETADLLARSGLSLFAPPGEPPPAIGSAGER